MTIEFGAFPIAQEAAFTPEEENILKVRMFTLLSKQVRRRTLGDHSSLREEDAAELLRSLLFTLRFQLHLESLPFRTLLAADLDTLLKQGQASLQACVDETRVLYLEVLQEVKPFGSRSLEDTLRGVGQFFRAYDLRLFAHCIPADIDYQLCLPVENGLGGVLYIREYLKRLLAENLLVTRFAPEPVYALLHRASPDYRDLLVNLYEPVAANAVGLALLEQEILPLKITPAQATAIHKQIAALSPGEAGAVLAEAADTVCDHLELPDVFSRNTLRQAAQTLYPRLILSARSACGVFLAIPSTVH